VYLCVRVSMCVGCMLQQFEPARKIQTRTRSGYVFAVDPINWRFEDRPMRDGDSDLKSHYFMSVSVLILFPYLLWSVDIYMLLVLLYMIV